MNEVQQELRTCSGCKSEILVSYFDTNRRGDLLKTCRDCRSRFKCRDCEFKTNRKNNLQIHIKQVHLKIKDYECPDCDLKFAVKNNLNNHIKQVHLKIKDYECNNCDYTCSRKEHLQKHIKQVHLKIKDHECPDCDYTCSEKGDLQKHIKICTGKSNCSSGEFQIMKTLTSMDISYEYNSSFELKNENNNYLRWDFIITDKISDKRLFIEYDGMQHFKPVQFGGISIKCAEENFTKQVRHDKLKNNYCKDNGYLLLRVDYKNFENINVLVVNFIRENTEWGIEDEK